MNTQTKETKHGELAPSLFIASGLLSDAALQLSRLTGENLEAYARTFAALAKTWNDGQLKNAAFICQTRAELLEALKKCKAVVENGNLPPSARMEFVRDYAAPAIAKAEGRGE